MYSKTEPEVMDRRRSSSKKSNTLFQPGPAQPAAQGMMAGVISRQAQEVQVAMAMAKMAPRDQMAAFNRVIQACRRRTLAEAALYSYPRGTEVIEGETIHLAKSIAQCWGNVDYGIVELEQNRGESIMMAYAWDLETNTRETRVFTVTHKRRAYGKNVDLDDPRDIYEITANMGARRLRACLKGIIPGDIFDAAIHECNKTLAAAGNEEPIQDRVRKMVVAFADYSVTQREIEMRLGHRIDVTTESELVSLRKIYTSLRNGMAKKEDWFRPLPTASPMEQSKEQPEDLIPMDHPKRPANGEKARTDSATHTEAADSKPSVVGLSSAIVKKIQGNAMGVTENDVLAYLAEGPGWIEPGQGFKDMNQDQLQYILDNFDELLAGVMGQ